MAALGKERKSSWVLSRGKESKQRHFLSGERLCDWWAGRVYIFVISHRGPLSLRPQRTLHTALSSRESCNAVKRWRCAPLGHPKWLGGGKRRRWEEAAAYALACRNGWDAPHVSGLPPCKTHLAILTLTTLLKLYTYLLEFKIETKALEISRLRDYIINLVRFLMYIQMQNIPVFASLVPYVAQTSFNIAAQYCSFSAIKSYHK